MMYSVRVERATTQTEGGVHTGALVAPNQNSNSIPFSAGNPRVEHVTGKVHLYREGEYSDDPASGMATSSHRVCVLGLPPKMGFSELCTYLGSSYEHVTEIRLVRREVAAGGDADCGEGHGKSDDDGYSTNGNNNALLVLLSFADVASAEVFCRDFHDTPFCLLEPEFVCRLLFVKDVELLDGCCDSGYDAGSAHAREIPSCPVCLDRLEPSASGIVTTVCNHRFHNQCLRQWVDSSCPVCRYVQGGDCGAEGGTSLSPVLECAHESCHSTVDLWMCLICGHTGCGRYRGSHAVKHFEETGHGFALELADGRGGQSGRASELVWDYMRDTYAHRVAVGDDRDHGDAIPASRHHSETGKDGPDRDDFNPKASTMDAALIQSKVDTVATELTQLMVTQMETQRKYYQKIVEDHHQETLKALAESNASASVAHAASAAADVAAQKAEQATRAVQRKNQDMAERLEKSRKEQVFLRQLNETLLSDTKGWREKVAALEGERDGLKATVDELNDQVKDLMMFIEARDAIEKGGFGAEAIGGDVGLVSKKETKKKGRR